MDRAREVAREHRERDAHAQREHRERDAHAQREHRERQMQEQARRQSLSVWTSVGVDDCSQTR